MPAAARLAALTAAAFAEAMPLVALAQGAGDPVPSGRTYGWLWMLVAAVVVFALFRMFFARSNRIPPPRGP